MAKASTVETAIRHHLAEMRRHGGGWRDPRLAAHRAAVKKLIRLRRLVRRGVS